MVTLRETVRRLFSGGETTAFLGLGSNVGDRLETLKAALEDLDADQDTTVEVVSGIYETEPVVPDEAEPSAAARSGSSDSTAESHHDAEDPQEHYLNAVVCVTTMRKPRDLMELAHEIEARHGRDRSRERRWRPRTLDIDLLLYDDEQIDEDDLVVPHPRLTERAFALVPLAEILPAGAELPDGTAVTSHLARMAPITGVELYVRLTEGPGTQSDPIHRRPKGPPGGPPRLGERQGGPGLPRRRRNPGDNPATRNR